MGSKGEITPLAVETMFDYAWLLDCLRFSWRRFHRLWGIQLFQNLPPPETNISPEHWWLVQMKKSWSLFSGHVHFHGGNSGKITSPKKDIASKTLYQFWGILVFSVSNQEICMMRPLILRIEASECVTTELDVFFLICRLLHSIVFFGRGVWGTQVFVYLHFSSISTVNSQTNIPFVPWILW